jgi:methionyl-tRNA formyltransferase
MVVHDDPDFMHAVNLWMKKDGFSSYETRREGNLTAIDDRLYILIKCHRIWLDLPRNTVVIHDGDLGKYRGCSPMRRAISKGETQITVTAFRPGVALDWGWVVGKQVFNVPEHWEPFCVSWHRSARAYAKLINRLCSGKENAIAPPPTMGQVYRKWGGRLTQEYLSAKQASGTIYWGLRACGPVANCGDYGKLDGKKVRWAELSGSAESYQMEPGQHRLEYGNILRFACADWRTILVEVE